MVFGIQESVVRTIQVFQIVIYMKDKDMTTTNNKELIGECINMYDAFHKENFDWIYKSALELSGNTLIAKSLADKMIAKLVLSSPDIIAQNNKEKCLERMALHLPYLGKGVDKKKELSAGRLLHIYYRPN